jgi:hypothetical protein
MGHATAWFSAISVRIDGAALDLVALRWDFHMEL